MFLVTMIAKALIARRPGLALPYAHKLATGILIVTVVVLAAGGIALWFHFHDKAVIDRHEMKREVAAGEQREIAGEERVTDALSNRAQEEEYREAIQSAPGGELSPAARALNCERLRRLGRIPAACRPAGGDGTEADPD